MIEQDKMKIDGLTHRRSAKFIAFVLLMISIALLIGSVIGAEVMWRYGVFRSTQEEFEEDIYTDMTKLSGENMLYDYIYSSEEYLEIYCGEMRSLEFEVVSGLTPYRTEGITSGDVELVAYPQTYYLGKVLDWGLLTEEPHVNEEGEIEYYTFTSQNERVTQLLANARFTAEEVDLKAFLEYEVETCVYRNLSYPTMDVYYFNNWFIQIAYGIKDFIWVMIAVFLILCCILAPFLLVSAGYRKGYSKRIVCGTARIPYEFVLGISFVLGACCIAGIVEGYYAITFYDSLAYGIFTGMCVVGLAALVMLFLMDFIVRVSTKTLLSNLLVVRIWKSMNLLGRCKRNGRKAARMLGELIKHLPLMWKAVVAYLVLGFLALIVIVPYWFETRFLFLILGHIVVLPVYLYCCFMFKKMQKASQSLGEGDLSYKVDTKYCFFEFKEMAESMNSIANGMEHAIGEQLKSERMKTELISNVSHDIKTPLTSIVNYADLISKEETDNPKIQEYSEILLRQSDRLKRLTEDLVHASKVTTGNVEVNLAPCDIGVLLAQAVGEYEEKMSAHSLKIITKQPEMPVVIEADGRHLWRVFDNLLNNICKYAQEGTRVYLVLQEIEDTVYITFKNISKYELNISEDELMERFVRGDESRHSEGNGLGLSIAKSLVEVQGGTLRVAIDGDLFKAVIKF